MIAETMTNPPRTIPGLVLLLLLAIIFGGLGYLAWLADQDRRDMELRERFRRDQAAQESWQETLRAMAPRSIP